MSRVAEDWNAFVAAMETAANNPLPGTDAHRRMSPSPRPGWKPGHIPDDARPGAVLLFWYPHHGVPSTILTLRRRDLPDHPGQVSLPGGMVDPGETPVEAALRETEEETGIMRSSVRVVGSLTPFYIPVSRFSLQPFVGISSEAPILNPALDEVERILVVSLKDLVDSGARGETRKTILGLERTVPHFELDGERVWGATAMVLSEFLEMLELV